MQNNLGCQKNSPHLVWGKLRRAQADGSVASIHTLIDHMIDVAACFLAIAQCHAVRQALQHAAGRPLTEVDLFRLAVLTFLHDIGKANAGFQAKYWQASDPMASFWPHPCGHDAEGWALFTQGGLIDQKLTEKVLKGLPLAEMSDWGESTRELLRASISHHGRPVRDDPVVAQKIWCPVLNGQILIYDPADAVASMGVAIRNFYPQAFSANHFALPDRPAFAHLFSGLVQLADWLGSDTREGFFPYSAPCEDRSKSAPDRARRAVQAMGLNVQHLRHALSDEVPAFSQAFGVLSPRPMQEAMAKAGWGPITVLEAETGSGKTEAALWRFLILFQAGLVDSLYFALPTRVAASQIYQRVNDFVHRVWSTNPPVAIRALPGYEAAEGATPMRLPEFRVLWSDDPNDAQAERRWAAESPKRYLAATIAVGTIDQALLGSLMVRHAHLRHAMLARSLLVVDEVHASDAYMTVLLEQLLQAHVACGGQALLLSATLGSTARTRFLNVGYPKKKITSPGLADAAIVPYPAISTRNAPLSRLEAVEGNPRHKVVHWQAIDAMDDPGRIATLAVDAARQGARVLVVRNTVPTAVATLHAVEELVLTCGMSHVLFTLSGVSTLHHSRFSRVDRPRLDREVELQLGKHRSGQGGRIVIGTQTLEQSLDIDADLLITDLCPMDVLLQRLGRLHRHARPSVENADDHRPEGFEAARAWVLTPTNNDLGPLLKSARHGLGPVRGGGKGLQGVYIDLRMLEATRRLIAAQPTRTIPTDNRWLVEHATHPEALDKISAELGADWQRFGMEVDGAVGATASIGYLHALPYDKPFDELQFPDNEQKIATRLGAADRAVEIEPPQPGPFGTEVHQLNLRHHQVAPDLPADAQAERFEARPKQGGFEFMLGTRRYSYSRFGLEHLNTSDPLANRSSAPTRSTNLGGSL